MCETAHMRTNVSGLRMNRTADFLSERARRKRFGELLARARKMAKLRQDQVSAYLRFGGRERVSKIENGKQPVDWLELEALATLYSCSTADFATWSEETSQQLKHSREAVDQLLQQPNRSARSKSAKTS